VTFTRIAAAFLYPALARQFFQGAPGTKCTGRATTAWFLPETAQNARWHSGCFAGSSCTMIEALFNQPNYVATKKMMDATALRHEAIASNLANVETPNYRRLDLAPNFTRELSAAMGSRDPARLGAIKPVLAEDASAVAATKDGNTVQLEHELLQLNQNTVAHALETQLVTGTLLKLRLAITGRPG